MGERLDHDRFDRRIMELGTRLWQKMDGPPSLFDRQYWQGQILEWIMADESFKVDAFRFVDVLPALHSTRAIASHVQDYLLKEGRNLPVFARSVLSMASGGIASPLATRAIRANITEMARRFICQSDSKKAVAAFEKLAAQNLTFTADILGEASSSEREADTYLQKYLHLIEILALAAQKWPENRQLYDSPHGPLPRANVSVKISALDPYLDAADHKNSVARLKERLLPLLKKAREHEVFINFDLEQWACHDMTYDLFEEVALEHDLVDWPHLGLVVQSYLKKSEHDCSRLLQLSKKRGAPFTVRLVKGAYWDYEIVNARQNGFPCPVYTNKGKTDACYEHLSRILIENHELISPAFASHNLRSLVHAMVVTEAKGLEKNCIELQMLYGMAEPQRQVLSQDGYRVRVYAPIGELLPGMAYLVRRLLENTSSSGFLRQSYHEGVAISSMLAPPVPAPGLAEMSFRKPGGLKSPFSNVDLSDFTQDQIRFQFAHALPVTAKEFPVQVPVVIGGISTCSGKQRIHVSPNDPNMQVAKVSQTSIPEAEKALNIAVQSFPDWRNKPLLERAELLEKLAGILEKKRFHFAALECHEVGKPWREADADAAEAIDFCRYYARQALKELGPVPQGNMAGEENILHYEGRGPCVVIGPWNFPLAILCGMSTAALVSGNTVLLKPSSSSSSVAYEFYQCLLEAGVPENVVQFLPGAGGELGDFLVQHPAVSQIAFTGSKEVGLSIIEKAGKTLAGQRQVKRVVCEMGGKNGIIIDEDADIDAALKGVMHSAFSYAGQKCSACSRLILVGAVYDSFIPRLLDACRSLPMASATDPGCRLGPVIDASAQKRLGEVISNPPAGAKRLFSGDTSLSGYFVPPAVFEVSDPRHILLQQEFFGPILTVMRAVDFREALTVANSTEFSLTGGVYSRSPTNIAAAREQFDVGNLYINRGCTGALVGRQPFGGFGMSGMGAKAGGAGYLLQFAQPRCITENTMRSGFTPDFQM